MRARHIVLIVVIAAVTTLIVDAAVGVVAVAILGAQGYEPFASLVWSALPTCTYAVTPPGQGTTPLAYIQTPTERVNVCRPGGGSGAAAVLGGSETPVSASTVTHMPVVCNLYVRFNGTNAQFSHVEVYQPSAADRTRDQEICAQLRQSVAAAGGTTSG